MFYMRETESRDEYISHRKKATKTHLFGIKKELRDSCIFITASKKCFSL